MKREQWKLALRAYEGMRWESIPWRMRLLVAITYPRRVARGLRAWFDQVTALPGYRGWFAARDVHFIVVSVKPSKVVCEVASGQLVHYFPSWPERVPEGCVRMYETIERTPFGWWH